MKTKTLLKLMRLYGQGIEPLPGQVYQVHSIPSRGSLSDAYPVKGEYGYSWCVMVKLARQFNNEDDGQLYYVGTPNAIGHPLLPSWIEIRDICHYVGTQLMYLPERERFSLEELMALNLRIGGNEWEYYLYS